MECSVECREKTGAAGYGVWDATWEKAVGGEVLLEPFVRGVPVLSGSGYQIVLEESVISGELDEAETGMNAKGIQQF